MSCRLLLHVSFSITTSVSAPVLNVFLSVREILHICLSPNAPVDLGGVVHRGALKALREMFAAFTGVGAQVLARRGVLEVHVFHAASGPVMSVIMLEIEIW